jgi:hypothetical protein
MSYGMSTTFSRNPSILGSFMIILLSVPKTTLGVNFEPPGFYYQMVQRMNCLQNQSITHESYLIRDKVAAFIITRGQDNVQHVAGELMTFWSQLGFVFGKFPFVGWTRGWYAEDTENNYDKMKENEPMRQDINKTISGAVEMSRLVRQNRYDECVLKQFRR